MVCSWISFIIDLKSTAVSPLGSNGYQGYSIKMVENSVSFSGVYKTQMYKKMTAFTMEF